MIQTSPSGDNSSFDSHQVGQSGTTEPITLPSASSISLMRLRYKGLKHEVTLETPIAIHPRSVLRWSGRQERQDFIAQPISMQFATETLENGKTIGKCFLRIGKAVDVLASENEHRTATPERSKIADYEEAFLDFPSALTRLASATTDLVRDKIAQVAQGNIAPGDYKLAKIDGLISMIEVFPHTSAPNRFFRRYYERKLSDSHTNKQKPLDRPFLLAENPSIPFEVSGTRYASLCLLPIVYFKPDQTLSDDFGYLLRRVIKSGNENIFHERTISIEKAAQFLDVLYRKYHNT